MKRIPLSVFLLIINTTVALELFALNLTQAPPETSSEANRRVLNSERIRLKFGSYGIDVLEDDGHVRVSSGEIGASPDFAGLYSSMGEIEPVGLAVLVYELFVSKNGNCFRYATIAEVHHPGYLEMNQLKGIYLVSAPLPNDRAGEVEVTLDATAAAMAAYQ